MDLIKPDVGLLFWMILSFGIVLYILAKFAWKPILNALKMREKTIEQRLEAARKAKEEMAKIEFGNEKVTALAKLEKENMLKDAAEMKEKIIEEAQKEAREEAKKIIEDTRMAIKKEKQMAIEEMKKNIASLSVEIAENVLKQQLDKDDNQASLINKLIDDIDLN